MSATPTFTLLAVGAQARAAATTAHELLQAGGGSVSPARVVQPSALAEAVLGSASPGAVVVVIGGMGVGPRHGTHAAVSSILSRPIPGFGELFRLISFRDEGADALLHSGLAGFVGPALVVALPAHESAVERAIDELLLPTLDRLLSAADAGAPVPAHHPKSEPADAPARPSSDAPSDDTEAQDDGEPGPPPPNPSWKLGAATVNAEAEPIEATAPSTDEALPDRGWKRAVYDLEAEVVRGKNPDTPQSLENFAPLFDILHQAGERARLDLPNGNRFDLYGFPDLQRANSKVIAIGWGEPLAEVIALHRYPTQAGLCIEEKRGLMPQRDTPIADVAVAVTGRAPPDTSGELFAVDRDAIYIQRGRWVYKWDGRRERKEGNPTQTLATLAVSWHNR